MDARKIVETESAKEFIQRRAHSPSLRKLLDTVAEQLLAKAKLWEAETGCKSSYPELLALLALVSHDMQSETSLQLAKTMKRYDNGWHSV